MKERMAGRLKNGFKTSMYVFTPMCPKPTESVKAAEWSSKMNTKAFFEMSMQLCGRPLPTHTSWEIAITIGVRGREARVDQGSNPNHLDGLYWINTTASIVLKRQHRWCIKFAFLPNVENCSSTYIIKYTTLCTIYKKIQNLPYIAKMQTITLNSTAPIWMWVFKVKKITFFKM